MSAIFLSILITILSAVLASPTQPPTEELPLSSIKLPPGFSISLYGRVPGARSLALSPGGTVFVGNRQGDKVFAIRDENGDGYAEKRYVLLKGSKDMPNGVAFRDGDLFIAEVSRILVLRDIETRLDNPPQPEVLFDSYPKETHHGWKYIAFGPDGWLYVPVGAPCNICLKEEQVYASITRIKPDGTGMEIFASGIRNTVGFTWHPETKELWFTDNGRDWLGDNAPSDELNCAPEKGLHFGYPFCHAGSIPDPEFGSRASCSEFVAPVQNLGPHVAALGLKFCATDRFPQEYFGNVLIAEHGSWNRSVPIGYRITLVKLEGRKSLSYEVFAEGWLGEEGTAWGRPVDLLWLEDGSLLVSDDKAGAIYKIWYEG